LTDLLRQRTTLAAPSVRLSGVGLHTGRPSWIQFQPAPSGAGVVFVDDASGVSIPALSGNVADTSRCTQLAAGGLVLQTVEHVLSALAGCGVDDAVVRFSGPEAPILDGSAAPFAGAIRAAGVATQTPAHPAPVMRLAGPVLVQDDHGGSVLALPADDASYTVVLNYPEHAYIGTQAAAFDPSAQSYENEIAPARTYGFMTELEGLRARGLALGATEENALALGEQGYLGERRFDNELARHKLLDLIGDLSLVGRPVAARFVAIKPGHTLNSRMARALLAAA